MNTALGHFAWAVVRFSFGLSIALFHGYGKVFEGKVEGLARTVADLGFPAPTVFAWAAALSEFVGGILVAVGLATRYAAGAVAAVMLVALYRHLSDPIAKMELAFLYLAVMSMCIIVGGGHYALDRVFKLRLPVGVRSEIGRAKP